MSHPINLRVYVGSYFNHYSRRKVVLKETELQHIHNQHSKPSKPF